MSRAKYLKLLEEKLQASQKVINQLVEENYMLSQLLKQKPPHERTAYSSQTG